MINIKEELKKPRTDFASLISKLPRRAATSSAPLRNTFYSPNSHDKYKHVIMFKNGIRNSKFEERRSQSMQGLLSESGKERVKFINFGSSSTTQESVTTKVEKYYQLCANKIDSIYNKKYKEEHESPPSRLSQTHNISNKSATNTKAKIKKESDHEELRRINSMDISSWLNKIEVVQVLDKNYKIPLQRASSKDYNRKDSVGLFKICNQSPIRRKRSMFNKRNDGEHEEFILDGWESGKNTIENPF